MYPNVRKQWKEKTIRNELHDIQSKSAFRACSKIARKWPRYKRTDESFISPNRFIEKRCIWIFDDAIELVVIALLLVCMEILYALLPRQFSKIFRFVSWKREIISFEQIFSKSIQSNRDFFSRVIFKSKFISKERYFEYFIISSLIKI